MAGLNPRVIWKCWSNRLAARIGQLASGDNWRRDLGRMTERDLMDIGLIRSDIHRITRGKPPPTDRPVL